MHTCKHVHSYNVYVYAQKYMYACVYIIYTYVCTAGTNAVGLALNWKTSNWANMAGNDVDLLVLHIDCTFAHNYSTKCVNIASYCMYAIYTVT